MDSSRKNTKLVICVIAILLAVAAGAAVYWHYLSAPRQQMTAVAPARSSRKPGQQSVVAGDQKSKVQSLLSQKKYDLAVAEARRYYNVAPLTHTGAAVQRLAAAIRQSSLYQDDPQFADKLVAQQQAGALTKFPQTTISEPNLLKSIPLDAEPYAAKIQALQGSDKYDELMACGDLMLLADRCAEARQTFLAAASVAKGTDKKLFDAVEGVARSIRAETGYAGPANAMILALALGEKPDVLSSIPEERWQKGDVQVAGQRVLLAQLSRTGNDPSAEDASDAETADNAQAASRAPPIKGSLGSYDLGDPLVVASLAMEPDSELVHWLQRWERVAHGQPGAGTTVSRVEPEDRAALQSLLRDTELPSMLLFHLGHAFEFSTQNDPASALFFQAGAMRANDELEKAKDTPHRAAIVRSMKDHLGGFRRILWPLIWRGDADAAEALSTIYASYVRWVPPNDRSLNKPVTHLKVGIAECLNAQHRYRETVAALEAVSDEEISRAGLRASADWEYGVALFELKQYARAAARFGTCARNPKFVFAEQACLLRSRALALSGDRDGAAATVDEWIARYRPSAGQVLQAMAAIETPLNARGPGQ